MIEAERLSKYFGDVRAVDDISFKIERGEVVAFLGPNGAGKTTTMRLLTGYIPPTMGNCRIKDLDVTENPTKIREFIGYLPENNPLYPDMKVYEYLEFVGNIRGLSDVKKRILEISGVCGIEDVLSDEVGALSKGYKQRVGVAQAIIHNPDILILDEPTEGLDPNQVVEVRGLIKELGKEKTVMLSTHILSEAEATCNRVLIINRGEIVADALREELGNLSRGEEITTLEVSTTENPLPLLSELPYVGNVEKRNGYYEIVSSEDIREKLFKFAVSRNWVILDMHRRVKSLEDVFRELTRE